MKTGLYQEGGMELVEQTKSYVKLWLKVWTKSTKGRVNVNSVWTEGTKGRRVNVNIVCVCLGRIIMVWECVLGFIVFVYVDWNGELFLHRICLENCGVNTSRLKWGIISP